MLRTNVKRLLAANIAARPNLGTISSIDKTPIMSRLPPISEPPKELEYLYSEMKVDYPQETEISKEPTHTWDTFKNLGWFDQEGQSNLADIYKHHIYKHPETGLTIATNLHGKEDENVTLGLAVKFGLAGQDVESLEKAGKPIILANIMEKLAWNGSKNYASDEEYRTHIDSLEAIMDCGLSRNLIMYAMKIPKKNLIAGFEILLDSIFNMDLNQEMIQIAVENLKFDLENSIDPTNQDISNEDAIHLAAFSGINKSKNYSLSKGVVAENLFKQDATSLDHKITVEDLNRHYASYFTPDRSFLIATGIDHESFAQESGQDLNKILSDMYDKYQNLNNFGTQKIDLEIVENFDNPPQYRFGYYKHKKDYVANMSHVELPLLTHFNIIYASPGFDDIKNYACLEILKAFLGGGDSFSSGGPGKGMYARLYKNSLGTGMFYTCSHKIIPYNNQSLSYIHFAPHFIGNEMQDNMLKDHCVKNVMAEINNLIMRFPLCLHQGYDLRVLEAGKFGFLAQRKTQIGSID